MLKHAEIPSMRTNYHGIIYNYPVSNKNKR